MFCSNCGQRLTDDAKHCPNCGVLIRRDTAEPDPGRPEEPKAPEAYSYGAAAGNEQPRQDPYANPYADPYGHPAAGAGAGAGAYAYAAAPQPTKADGYALTGLILGIVSGVCCCLPFIGLPCAVLGIIFSAKGLKSESRKAMAVIGLILSIIFVCCNLVTAYSFIKALSNPDAWADILNGADFDYGFDFRLR